MSSRFEDLSGETFQAWLINEVMATARNTHIDVGLPMKSRAEWNEIQARTYQGLQIRDGGPIKAEGQLYGPFQPNWLRARVEQRHAEATEGQRAANETLEIQIGAYRQAMDGLLGGSVMTVSSQSGKGFRIMGKEPAADDPVRLVGARYVEFIPMNCSAILLDDEGNKREVPLLRDVPGCEGEPAIYDEDAAIETIAFPEVQRALLANYLLAQASVQ